MSEPDFRSLEFIQFKASGRCKVCCNANSFFSFENVSVIRASTVDCIYVVTCNHNNFDISSPTR